MLNQQNQPISDNLAILAQGQLNMLGIALNVGDTLTVGPNRITITRIYYLDTHNCVCIDASDGVKTQQISLSKLAAAIANNQITINQEARSENHN
jgi:hypothetical protein